MNNTRRDAPFLTFLATAAAFVVVVAGLRAAAPIVIPCLVSVFIAVLSGPIVKWLQARGLPIWAALVVVICGIVVLGTAVVALIGSSAADFSQKLPNYERKLTQLKDNVIDWLELHGATLQGKLNQDAFNVHRVLQIMANVLNSLSGIFGNIFLILLTIIFLLLEAHTLPGKLGALPGNAEATRQRFARITADIRHYMAIKTWVSLLTGALVVALLKFVGVDYALMWGMIAFFMNFVPNIGSIIAAVPAVLLALIQLGPMPAAYVALGFVAINGVIGNFLEPRLMGRGLGLSTLVVFVSLVFWGWVLGPVGMVLSVPLTMIVKIFLEADPQSRWIGVLLGNEAPSESPAVASTNS